MSTPKKQSQTWAWSVLLRASEDIPGDLESQDFL